MKATFEADFSSFKTAVDQAVVQLKGFEASAEKTSASLSSMVDKFSGRAVVEQAMLAAKAVEQIGGAAKLSENDLNALAKTTEAAMDRFLAFGAEVPPELEKLAADIVKTRTEAEKFKQEVDSWGVQTVKAGTGASALNRSLETTNTLLAVGGEMFGVQTRGLEQLAAVAENAAGGLSTLAKANIYARTAQEAWKIGNMLADFAEQNRIIPEATAALLGWGDVAKETAAANAEVLAKATNATGREITNLSEAMRINTEKAKEWADHLKYVADQAFDRLRKEMKEYNDGLEFVRKNQEMLAEQEKKLAEQRKKALEDEKKIREEIIKLESGAPKPGLLGLSAAEQASTQKEFAAAGKLITPDVLAAERRAAAPTGISPETAAVMQAQKDYADELTRLTTLEKQLSEAEGRRVTLGQMRLDAEAKYLAAINAATAALQRMVTPEIGHGPETPTAWSPLVPKPISVKPIAGSFFNYGAGGMGTNQPLTDWATRFAVSPNLERKSEQIITMNISGVWDPATINQISDAVGKNLMQLSGRKFPAS